MAAAAENMGIVNEDHVAGASADHLQTIPRGPGKGQGLAEDPPDAQILQYRGHALLVNADQGGLTPLHHAYSVGGEVVYQLVGPEGPLNRLETGQNFPVILVADVVKQRTFFQLLLTKHVLIPFCCISHTI